MPGQTMGQTIAASSIAGWGPADTGEDVNDVLSNSGSRLPSLEG